jgi:predicted nucleic acid-binding protein
LARASLKPAKPAGYEDAAVLYRTCRRSRETVPKLIDCFIAAIAIRTDLPVLHVETDFEVPLAIPRCG